MNDQRLYIDGQLVDIDEGTRITLTYQSNLFRDISKMAGNFSYTVKLPNTAKNRAIILNSDRVETYSSFPYFPHMVDYYRNGVQIIGGASAVLLSVGDTIDISLSWGATDGLRKLVTDGATLNKLSSVDTVTYDNTGTGSYAFPLWSTIENDPDATAHPYIYARSNFYRPNTDKYIERQIQGYEYLATRPFIRVPRILRAIEQDYGITLDFSSVWSMVAFLAIPLTTIKASYVADADTLSVNGWASPPDGVRLLFTSNNAANVFTSIMSQTAAAAVSVAKEVGVTLNISASFTRSEAERVAPAAVVRVVRYNSSNAIQEYTDVSFTLSDVTAATARLSVTGTYSFAMDAGDYLSFLVVSDTLDVITLETTASTLSQGGGTIEGRDGSSSPDQYDDEYPDVTFGNPIPVFPNLPAIKITDFIKSLCVLTGTFPKNAQGNTIHFLPFHTLWDNTAQAYDWTKRIEPQYDHDKPWSGEYKVGEYAQNNWYRYTGENDYNGEYDGNLQVPNRTLDENKDFYKNPFSPSQTHVFYRFVRIPIYSISNANELINGKESVPVYQTNDVKPRIVLLQPAITMHDTPNPIVQATFDGLGLQTAIATRYTDIVRSLNYAMVIKERIRLSDVELQSFDETIPVYLAQYGAFFAVTEIKTDSEGNADVTLLRMAEKVVQPSPEPPTPPTPVLPYDAKVEYIEFTGTQHIDTGIIPSNTHGIWLDIQPNGTNDRTYAGMRNSSSTNTRFTIGATANFYYGWGAFYNLNNAANNGERHQIELNFLNSRQVKYDGAVKSSPGNLNFTPTLPIFIGRNNNGGSAASAAVSKMYGVKISKGEDVIFDGIPVRKNGKGCLYDKVTGTLYENVGAGDIGYGNDV